LLEPDEVLQPVSEEAAQRQGTKGACTWVRTSHQAEGPWAWRDAGQSQSAVLHGPVHPESTAQGALGHIHLLLSAWLTASASERWVTASGSS